MEKVTSSTSESPKGRTGGFLSVEQGSDRITFPL